MAVGLFDRMFSCRHEFSWPRRDEDGTYYQVCLHCGVRYGYDWRRMRRLERLRTDDVRVSSVDAEAGRKPARKCGSRPRWSPRERRLRWQVPIQLRKAQPAGAPWVEAVTENVSRSGVLVRTAAVLAPTTSLELMMEMPSEIIGQSGIRVLCTGTVVRVGEGGENNDHVVGVRIDEYQLLEARAS